MKKAKAAMPITSILCWPFTHPDYICE